MMRLKRQWIVLGLLGLFTLGISKNVDAAFPSDLDSKPLIASAVDGSMVTVYEDSTLKKSKVEIHSEGLKIKAVDVSEDQKALYGSYKNDVGQRGKGWLSSNTFVRESGYKHIYATVREKMTIYSDWDLSTIKTRIRKYSGVIAMNEEGEALQVVYETKKGYGIGWLSKENFENTLRYDGRDKQILRNGRYHFTNAVSQKQWRLEYKSKKMYYIYDVEEKAYLSVERMDANNYDPSQEEKAEWMKKGINHEIFMLLDKSYRKKVKDWKESKKERKAKKEEYDRLVESGLIYEDAQKRNAYQMTFSKEKDNASAFVIEGRGTDYSIKYGKSILRLGFNENGNLILQTKIEDEANFLWKVRAAEPLMDLKDPMVITQYDPKWCAKPYGGGGSMGTAGCGVLATVNAVYNLTGQYMDVMDLADFAVRKNYRIVGSGTTEEIFQGAAEEYGDRYGFEWDGASDNIKVLRKKLKKGDVATVHVIGHYVSIIGYNEKTKKYLLLDSNYLPKRETSAFGDWVSENRLLDGYLYGQMYYFYKLKND